ncbi:hypothetical protein [Massilia haematophila]|uniref:Uncharacterized protein n=1 Tax=Massilia haematophila TaxID=457923 RepID=A0ABV7PNI5_9BURK
MSITSVAERTALAKFAKLPFDIKPSQTFAPLLTSNYRDGAGVELIGKPDALCTQAHCYTYIESKAGRLNHHPDKASSHRALQDEYTSRTFDMREKSYAFLTDYFYRNSPVFLHDHAFNQSLFKVLAMQTQYGWERYLVVFAQNPKSVDAQRYAEAGLVWCTLATLETMLTVIAAAAEGFYFPFFLNAYRSHYTVTVNPFPNPAHAGFTPEQVAAANRAQFEAVVAARRAEAQHAPDFDPF